jgi:hypothetical protein
VQHLCGRSNLPNMFFLEGGVIDPDLDGLSLARFSSPLMICIWQTVVLSSTLTMTWIPLPYAIPLGRLPAGQSGIGRVKQQYSRHSTEWWRGTNINIGTAASSQYQGNRFCRRDFRSGMVLMNPSGATVRNVLLPKMSSTIDGQMVEASAKGLCDVPTSSGK